MQDPVLAAQCDALNQAVRQKRVPKAQRGEARRLLGAAFAFEAPLHEAPLLEAPLLEAPLLEAPLLEAPLLEAPLLEAPLLEAPLLEAPLLEAPLHEAPLHEAPLQDCEDAPEALPEAERRTRIAGLIDAIEVLLRSSSPSAEAFSPLTSRRRIDPVRIRCARPLSPRGVAAVAARYLDMGKKLDERVEWMWARCKQNNLEPKREMTAREKAAEEFSGDDLEFVWGKKRL